jgi:hypothetical protein
MTQQRLIQGLQEIGPLLAQGRQIPAKTTQDLAAQIGSQATRDFLLDFEHPQIPFRMVVGARKVFDVVTFDQSWPQMR